MIKQEHIHLCDPEDFDQLQADGAQVQLQPEYVYDIKEIYMNKNSLYMTLIYHFWLISTIASKENLKRGYRMYEKQFSNS